ncbi:DUF3226 domain-containing protein [Spirosoma montaniterrae]|uniref:DUF4276 family protein n=1 Tax=Spirosoma montaniterrae TaxID=1178516 RepID=A0A1P9WSM6_9BACT|nr:DUF3226 domain-containing protein [Spirosoma montaniterrae]AQG78372.1 hypothetical protein AWR27_02885 [Spirosoma montaniterrae]
MSNVQIFVEGVADQKFFQDLIHEWYGLKLSKGKFAEKNTRVEAGDIFDMGGQDSFADPIRMNLLSPIIQTLRIEEIPMLVIFDADEYIVKQPDIDMFCQEQGFSYFLLPFNGTHSDADKNDGDLETLLQEVICPDNQIIFDCWQTYEQCLATKKALNTASGAFTLPARKTKIYAYLEALLGETKTQKKLIKEEHRDYRNKKHWNLDPAHPALKPLKEFLDPFFS